MKTAEEKALDFIIGYIDDPAPADEKLMFRKLVKLLKEQDRDTRHACAEVVSNMVIVPDDQDVVNAIMNTKAV